MTYLAKLFEFGVTPGESISARIVRCCSDALNAGPMGQAERADFYRDFIACNQEESLAKARALATVKTSCALFVRAVRHWCGAAPAGPYQIGSAMFKSMGNVSYAHDAWVPAARGEPKPGDYFYIASIKITNDGHTGIFIEELSPGRFRTAEGGGGDGTVCKFTERRLVGNRFENDHRTLWGWFDCEKVGLPASPTPARALDA